MCYISQWLNCQTLQVIAQSGTAIVAIFSIYAGFQKYKENQKSKRIQYLLDFGKRYKEDSDIMSVANILAELEDNPNTDCSNITVYEVEMYMRFFEELELLIENTAVEESDAIYLFGHYTKVLENYHDRWPTLGYEEEYWSKFRRFVNRTKKYNF